MGKTRSQETVAARQIVMFLTRSLTNLSLKNIGRELGGRDHSTVLHACRVIEKRSKQDVRISNLVGGLKSELTFAKS